MDGAGDQQPPAATTAATGDNNNNTSTTPTPPVSVSGDVTPPPPALVVSAPSDTKYAMSAPASPAKDLLARRRLAAGATSEAEKDARIRILQTDLRNLQAEREAERVNSGNYLIIPFF
jgi:hypothetical protein